MIVALLGFATAHKGATYTVTPTEVSFSSVTGPPVTILDRLFNSGDAANKPAVIMLHGCAGIYSSTCWAYDRNTTCYSKVTTTTNCDTSCCWTSDRRASKISPIYLEWGDRLVANGYVALLVDSFGPRDAGYQCTTKCAANAVGTGVSEIFERPHDVAAAYAYLKTLKSSTNDPIVNVERVGLLGWSHGGSTVLASLAISDPISPATVMNPLAVSRPYKVGVAFYGCCGFSHTLCSANGTTISACWGGLSSSKWGSFSPVFLYHGTKDTVCLLDNCNTRIAKAQTLDTPLYPSGSSLATIMSYADAVHSFYDPSSSLGGGVCSTLAPSTTPNQCAKQVADPDAMTQLNKYLKTGVYQPTGLPTPATVPGGLTAKATITNAPTLLPIVTPAAKTPTIKSPAPPASRLLSLAVQLEASGTSSRSARNDQALLNVEDAQ